MDENSDLLLGVPWSSKRCEAEFSEAFWNGFWQNFLPSWAPTAYLKEKKIDAKTPSLVDIISWWVVDR